MLTRDEVVARIDAICNAGKARREAADDSIRWLRPTDSDWLTADEARELHGLQLCLSTFRESREVIRARVARKRALRKRLKQLEVELHEVNAKIDAAYWTFTRTARGKPPAIAVPEAYRRRKEIEVELHEVKKVLDDYRKAGY